MNILILYLLYFVVNLISTLQLIKDVCFVNLLLFI